MVLFSLLRRLNQRQLLPPPALVIAVFTSSRFSGDTRAIMQSPPPAPDNFAPQAPAPLAALISDSSFQSSPRDREDTPD